jgi:Tol biopolymer transport system component
MRRIIPTSLILIFAVISVARSQEGDFGENKVRYKDFDWYYIQTNHFDIYFSQGGEYLADFTAAAAESAYTMLSKSLRYQLNNRVPIIVYNSHNDFQQTNVVSEYLEEGIGGVTEQFKNRVNVPFEGSYKQFRHVIHHELLHAFVNDMFYGGSVQSMISNNIRLELPMWFNEGLAEYESLGWDTNSDMFMIDATIHQYVPPIDYLNGYLAYRGGQSLWHYIATKYGEQKISEILNRIKGTHSVEQGFKSALGLSISELNDRWQKENKVLYWPEIAKREDPTDFATRITDHEKDGSFYNTSPSISPQGDKIAFISDRDDYFDVFVVSTITKKVTKIVNGQQTKNFEELHLLTPGIGWSPDGKKIALAVKAGNHDAIFIVDVATGDKQELDFNLDGIFSVSWSPKGDKLAFVGDNDRESDIYAYDLNTKNLINLTSDVFSDEEPSWSPDGETIYFSSDRRNYINPKDIPAHFKMGHYDFSQDDIYSINVETKEMKRITDYPQSDETFSVVSPDGKKLLYVSDRNGIGNIYERNLITGEDRPITNSLEGIAQLSLSKDGNKLVFSALEDGGYDIFLMKTPFEKKLDVKELEPTAFIKQQEELAARTSVDSTALKDSAAVVAKKDTTDTTGVYGNNIHIDFGNYVFNEAGTKEREEEQPAPKKDVEVTDNLDKNGNYKVYKYKLNFSPDIIYGNAAFSTFYGVEGTTLMEFSDMLGDNQIYFLTNLMLDLQNSDYMLAYYYLPKRINYGFEGFHSARFLYLDTQYGTDLYRFQTWGFEGSASYPFDKYNRTEFGLTWLGLSRQNLDLDTNDNQQRGLLIPSIAYVHDNTLWGITAPDIGTRYNITAMMSPKIAGDGLDFQTVTFDYRTYLNFLKDYCFVVRWTGGASGGPNPQHFFIGGTDGWINREFANGGIPIENVEDYAFLSPVLPLRGYDYNAENGTYYGLMNYELRYPLIRYLITGGIPLAFENITGATFIDMGSAWSDTKTYKFFSKNDNGNTVTQDLLVGMGFGARMIFLGLPLKFDVAWSYDAHSFSIPKYYISLGEDF